MVEMKSSLRAAFFLFVVALSTLFGAQCAHAGAPAKLSSDSKTLEQTAMSPVWAALVHFRDGKPQILDGSFLLSAPNFSLANELSQTIEAFVGKDRVETACRFPARYFWLHANNVIPAIDLSGCNELGEFISEVPAESISLVFASENLSQPSSMMGHVFLKMSGRDANMQLRQHAISFYTNAATINIPKLLLENFVTGMAGFYALAPYQELVHQYVAKENRTLWDFQLRLNPEQSELLRRHLFELRHVKFKYYFHSYNCASLVKELLALIAPDIADRQDLWTTPKDVIRDADRAGLIESTQVIPSTQWTIRSLTNLLSEADRSAVTEALDSNADWNLPASLSAEYGFGLWNFANSYNDYLLEKERVSASAWKLRHDGLQAYAPAPSEGLSLAINDSAKPTSSPLDSQFAIGGLVRGNTRFVSLRMLPASHTLLDNQPSSFGESELRLFETTLLVSPEREALQLDRFTLYATSSLLPWSGALRDASSSVDIGYHHQYDPELNDHHTATARSAWGVAFNMGQDAIAFGLLGGGLGYCEQVGYASAHGRIGLVVHELWGMKSILSVETEWHPLGHSGSVSSLQFEHQIPLGKFHALEVRYSQTTSDTSSRTVHEGSLLYKHMF